MPVAKKIKSPQRYKPVYGENPLCKAHMTAIMVPDYYNGEWIRYNDHVEVVIAMQDEINRLKGV